MAITINQSKISREIKLTMGITKFIPDLIRPAKYFQVDLRKSINIPGNICSWKRQFRNRKTRSSLFALMCFSLHFSFYLYILSNASLASFIHIACSLWYPSLFSYCLLPYVRNTSKVVTASEKREQIIYSFIVLQSIWFCMCGLTWGWARRTAACSGKQVWTRKDTRAPASNHPHWEAAGSARATAVTSAK